jgi:serine/threonine protein phosphatase PrpC
MYRHVLQLPPKDQIITAEPDVTSQRLTPDDRFLVLACDGIWDVMTK